MADSQEVQEQSEPGEAKRRRSAARTAFPRVPISKVIPLAEAIWEEGHGEQVRATAAFARLNRSPTSGASRTLIASANSGYGLVNGNANSTYLALTDLGKTLAAASSASEKSAAIAEALFNNPIFTSVHNRYENRPLPSDQVVRDYIKNDAALSEEDAAICWTVVSENLRYAGLLIKEGGKDVIVSRQSAAPLTRTETNVEASRGDTNHTREETNESPPPPDERIVGLPQAEFHLNVQIHLPNDADAETYDAIFASIARNLLQRDA